MKIGEAAKKTGLTVSNIRFYEKKGLLKPKREIESKYRTYTQEDIQTLKWIVVFRKMDLSIEDIAELLEEKEKLPEVLERQEQRLSRQMEELEGSLELCRLLRCEKEFAYAQPEKYLCYIDREEEKGKKYASVADVIEDLADYAESGHSYLMGLWFQIFGNYAYLGKYLYLLLWVLWLVIIIISIIRRTATIGFLVLWTGFFAIQILGAVKYLQSRNNK